MQRTTRSDTMSAIVAPGFESVLAEFSAETLTSETSTVVGLAADFTLAYLNDHWLRFAEKNDGPDLDESKAYLGRSLFEFIPADLQEYYRSFFATVRLEAETERHPAQMEYDCNSPELYRLMSMTVYPARGSNGMLVVHSTIREAPLGSRFELHHPDDRHEYMDEGGFIHQCAHCRRVMHPREQGRWDMVPGLIERMDLRISHTLCLFCRDVFWNV